MSGTDREDWEYARDIALPFVLSLRSGWRLECRQILRLLPGRRLVCKAAVLDSVGAGLHKQELPILQQDVLLKLFMGAERDKDAEADATGAIALSDADIHTPQLLLRDEVRDKHYPVLLFEFISSAQSFNDAWRLGVGQPELLTSLLHMVARQHRAGLRQRDFHLQNFLLGEQHELFAIDGGEYAIGRVGRSQVQRNLGMLFGHLSREWLADSPDWLYVYLEARGWTAAQLDYRQVLRRAERFRRRRARRISRKAFRNCSEFRVRRYQRYRITQRRDFPAEVLDQWLSKENPAEPQAEDLMLKSGNSQTVWRTGLGGRPVVVKRYNLKSRMHVVKRALGRSRASRAWENAFRLRAYHLPTPEPLAMIETRQGPFGGRAWLVTEWNPGTRAQAYFQQAEQSSESLEVAKNLAALVQKLADNGIVHGDLKASNFLLQGNRIDLIDLDSMRFPGSVRGKRGGIAADRRRFLANWSGSHWGPVFERLLSESNT